MILKNNSFSSKFFISKMPLALLLSPTFKQLTSPIFLSVINHQKDKEVKKNRYLIISFIKASNFDKANPVF